MNFLAHLWLADQTGAELAGAILGDIVRGRIHAQPLHDSSGQSFAGIPPDVFPAGLARSILLHRRIDAATDRHPLVRAALANFQPGARRYAGVLIDLINDHVLACNWPGSSRQPLDDFALRAGREMAAASDWFVRAGSAAPTEAGFRDLLLSYATEAGLERAVSRTAMRLRKPEGLLDAAQGWQKHRGKLAADLPALLEDLRETALAFMSADQVPASAQQ